MSHEVEPNGRVEERVARGAAWLDKEKPGWREDINLDALTMSSCSRCVLGQLYRDFLGGLSVLRDSQPPGTINSVLATQYGFDRGCEGESEWAMLKTAWTREISKRSSGGK